MNLLQKRNRTERIEEETCVRGSAAKLHVAGLMARARNSAVADAQWRASCVKEACSSRFRRHVAWASVSY